VIYHHMATKHWVKAAVRSLEESLSPTPHEVNEIDWKAHLSNQKDRLAEHLMAFANHSHGGCLAFGISNEGLPVGVSAEDISQIANTLANLGRDGAAGTCPGAGYQACAPARKIDRGNLDPLGRYHPQGFAAGSGRTHAQQRHAALGRATRIAPGQLGRGAAAA
jgi:hypothetical protein